MELSLALANRFFKRPPKVNPLPLNPLSSLFCAYLTAVKDACPCEAERLADAVALALLDARARRFKRVCVAYLLGADVLEGALRTLEQRGVEVTKREVRHGVFVYAGLEG